MTGPWESARDRLQLSRHLSPPSAGWHVFWRCEWGRPAVPSLCRGGLLTAVSLKLPVSLWVDAAVTAPAVGRSRRPAYTSSGFFWLALIAAGALPGLRERWPGTSRGQLSGLIRWVIPVSSGGVLFMGTSHTRGNVRMCCGPQPMGPVVASVPTLTADFLRASRRCSTLRLGVSRACSSQSRDR